MWLTKKEKEIPIPLITTMTADDNNDDISIPFMIKSLLQTYTKWISGSYVSIKFKFLSDLLKFHSTS